jgi:Protein of unknown function (DUF2946)
MQTRNKISGCLSLWVAVLCIVGQVSSFAHLLLIRHTACAAHQSLLEETGAHQPSPEGAQQSHYDTAEQQADNPQHDHEDCLLCTQKQKLASIPKVNAVLLLLASCLAPRAPTHLVAFSTQDLFSLAPKTSPPLV